MSTGARTVAVTGASGVVGFALVRRLLEDGHVVHALVRPTSARRQRLYALGDPRLRLFEGDIENPASLTAVFGGATVVIHAAARTLFFGTRAEFMRTNAEGTENVLSAAADSGVKRFVFISSTDVYGYVRKPRIDESVPTRPGAVAYADSKIAAEHIVRRFASRGVECTTVRPATVVGPGSAVVDETIRFVKGGVICIDHGRANAGLCAVENLVDAIVLLSRHPDAAGNTYNVTDNLPVTFKTWAEDVAQMLGVSPVTRSIPYAIAVPAAYISELWTSARHGSQQRPALPLRDVRLLGQPQDFSTDRLRRLGWTPRVSYKEILESIRADLRRRK